ncbi:MAG: cell division protein SepF [Clostridia bacterium]|nr:cell division protein SepF [Clostridia bacterium]MBQ7121034.1 cell division protein SepF [Clostridia bacterium]
MGFKDKLKQFINVSDDDYIDGADTAYEDDFDYSPAQPQAPATRQAQQARTERTTGASNNVVNINSSKQNAGQPKPHVVFQKIDRFEEVGEVADILNEKRIVILNLETCPNDVSQRIIDFLYGVAYANHGDFKKVAGRAYIITPYNVPVSGELLDELSGMGDGQQ